MMMIIGVVVVGALVVCAGCALIGAELGRGVLMP